MLREWGPLFTLNSVLGNSGIALIAALAWSSGHLIWLVLNNKKIPSWVFKFFDERLIKQSKPRQIYINKGLAWFINIFWAWTKLFVSPGGDASPYKPIIGNIILLDIGGIVFEFTMFLILMSLVRWSIYDNKD